MKRVLAGFEWLILVGSLVTLLYWLTGKGLFYSDTQPVLSAFTSVSLLIMIIPRMANRYTDTWPPTISLALLGVVACGNATSLLIQLMTPELFFTAIPSAVPTSAITSTGIILVCAYEILIILRKTPKTAFILDDILLHLALFPGALSLLGHLSGVQVYRGSSIDPRVGVSILEMLLMGSFVFVAAVSNRDLFLWSFLSKKQINRMIFIILFANQYVFAFALAPFLRSPNLSTHQVGIEFYILLAGALATLLFLILNAASKNRTQIE